MQTTSNTLTVRGLLIVALLCFAGLQILEPVHSHPLGETTVHCQLCHHMPYAPVSLGVALALLSIYLGSRPPASIRSSLSNFPVAPFDSRGPPNS